MTSDYKTTITYFAVVLCFIYSVYSENIGLVSATSIPLFIMWIILKTNSKELSKDFIDILKIKWSK